MESTNGPIKLSVLFQLVKEESASLLKHASKTELSKLDINKVDNSRSSCIYGQMTGHCNSRRAIQLIKECSSHVYNVVNRCELTLNGSPKDKDRGNGIGIFFFSPIETMLQEIDTRQQYYPFKVTDNIRNLVNYLRGETDELVLTEEGMDVL